MRLHHFLSFYYFLQILLLMIGGLSVLRQLGVINITVVLLAGSWLIDIVFIFFALSVIRKFEIPGWVLLSASVLILAPLIGLGNQFLNRTFMTDMIVYYTFFFKIFIFYHLFKDIKYVNQYHRFLNSYTFWAVVVGVLTISIMTLLKNYGHKFYFSSSPDITFAYAMSIVKGNTIGSYFIMLIGVLSGKRMLFVGLSVIFLLSFRRYVSSTRHNLIMVAVILGGMLFLETTNYLALPGIAKIQQVFSTEASDFVELLQKAAPHRFNEVLSIMYVMEWYDYILGKGFGFRFFWLGNEELHEAGITHSNAHFTPFGLVSKFGILGASLFFIMFFYVLRKAFKLRKESPISYMNYLFMVSILIQSLFAYILFNNTLVPLVIAYVLSQRNKQ
ncbi:MAG: hypothetical protein ACFHVJ_20125 [Aestuariibacter sp.]